MTELENNPSEGGLREVLRISWPASLTMLNATITRFDHSHDDLWVIQVKPDRADVSHRAGQYTTLGLGYWEPRVDDAEEDLDEDRRQRLIRRSYSISSPIIDEVGYLSYDARAADLLFEVVNRRYEAERPILMTTNLAFKDWPTVFPNASCLVALIERLTHHADICLLEGESYRRREAEAERKARRSPKTKT